MGAFKLETFDATEDPGSGLSGLRSDILERERNEAYARGFKDGVNVTNDSIENEQNRLLSAIAEQIADRNFTHEEASQAVLRSIAPLIEMVIRKTAPTIAGSSFHVTLTDMVISACKRSVSGGVRLEVPVGQGQAMAALFAARELDLTVAENPDFAPREARLNWDGGTDMLDLDRVVTEIDTCLTEFLQTMNEGTNERARDAG